MGFFKTWKTVILDPKVFFSKLPNKMGLREPSIFYLKLQTISWLLVAIVMGFWLIPSGGFSLVSSLFGGVGILVGLLLGILTVVVMIFLSWGMMFVGAGVIHLFVRAFGGIKEYKETFKAMAYGCAILALKTPFNNEMLQEGKYGLFFKKEIKAIINMINYCEKENILIEKLRYKSVSGISEKYDWDFIVTQYIDVFKNLIYKRN